MSEKIGLVPAMLFNSGNDVFTVHRCRASNEQKVPTPLGGWNRAEAARWCLFVQDSPLSSREHPSHLQLQGTAPAVKTRHSSADRKPLGGCGAEREPMPPAKRPVATRAQAPPRHVEQEEQEDDSGSEELDAAALDMSSDEDAGALPSGSDSEADADADADDEGEEGEGDEELREALFDYQTTAARLREEEEAGAAGDGAGAAGTSAGDGDDEGWVAHRALQPKAQARSKQTIYL